jgi:UDPglucose 6-dehydrogenase
LKIVKLMKTKAIFDGRNLFETDAVKELGFYYASVGRATGIPANGVQTK